MKHFVCMAIMSLVAVSSAAGQDRGIHLFILSGQSNMEEMDQAEMFIPIVAKEFGRENIKVVKYAKSGQPIRRWYKDWRDAAGNIPQTTGDIYDTLMYRVRIAVQNREVASVSFIWMHGEKDAQEGHGVVYKKSLKGLIQQLEDDLQREDINVIIGRLSDFDLDDSKFPHWSMIRRAQVEAVLENRFWRWVDTDLLNDGKDKYGKTLKNDLHYSAEGYRALAKRFAKVAIQLIDLRRSTASGSVAGEK